MRFSTAPATDGLANRPILFVSGGYLRLLGGRPLLGHTLDASDDTPAAPTAIVVSDRFWRTTLDGDPSVVGRTVWINGAPATLVGVGQVALGEPGLPVVVALHGRDDVLDRGEAKRGRVGQLGTDGRGDFPRGVIGRARNDRAEPVPSSCPR